VTVRLTVVVWLALFGPLLVPVIVTVWAPEGAMFGKVAMVTLIVDGLEGLPLRVTLPVLPKLQVAPVGRPLQLAGVKFTVPVNPLAGVIVRLVMNELPAEMLPLPWTGAIVKGTVTVTEAELEDAELLFLPSPP
jgi:hypothetical protein